MEYIINTFSNSANVYCRAGINYISYTFCNLVFKSKTQIYIEQRLLHLANTIYLRKTIFIKKVHIVVIHKTNSFP